MVEPTLELRIDNIAQGGEGVGRYNGMVVFVPGALPGELVRARIAKTSSSFIRAEMRDVLEPSPDRVAPAVEPADQAPWQHIAYPAQLEFKATIVQEQLAKLAGVHDAPLQPTLPAAWPWNYRNTIKLHADGGLLGYYAGNSHDIVDLDEDPLALPVINAMLIGLRRAMGMPGPGLESKPRNLPIRGVTLRASAAYGYGAAALEFAPGVTLPELEALAERWRSNTPALAGVMLSNGRVLSGTTDLHDELGGVTFVLGVESFFQVNAAQAERMIALVREQLDLQPGERLIDAYSGAGTFALPLADGLEEVIAIESHPGAVSDGKRSAELNGITNVRFIAGSAERVLSVLEDETHAVILDPPRRGCHPQALAGVIRLGPARIAYISCHPGILARDLKPLLEAGYRLKLVQPVDLFPQTPHIETIVMLEK